ncbi:FAD-dependent oxidoreductase [Pseudomonas sp. UBA2684]|uniref:FAD-dependent oxidoreductase n=1 Tax=Pseudomonas sp. UBA2684 TaxID=1947311 RepID=UPI0025E73512|nr:FAD-dependent oxidoreductase [Pseudomonas sp. UBA2684]|tara:strand:+ start:2210 stop:3286 length:1077 start_codon:yes stop_codon:yes gene_type:complete
MNHYDLLLLGAGHAHLGVLRRWAMIERPPGRIGLISAGPTAWYSGMLPGLLAGRQHPADCQVELPALCRAAKVELIIQPVESLSAVQQQVQLADGQTLTASWLSLNVGAQVAAPPQQGTAMQLLAVKPFAEFLAGWQQWQAAPQPLAILGGGAAGVELALALAGQVPQLALFCAGHLLDGLSAGVRLRALGHLRQRGVWVREDCPISRIEDDCLLSGDEPVWRGQRLLLASGAQAWPWLAHSGLGGDEQGFVLIAPTLQSYTHPTIFAVGDCASLPGARKSGVYAVRQGPVLAANLNAALRGLPLRRYRPQRQSLALLATGDGGALLDWHGYSAGGQLFGRWKDYLDRGFIQRHRLSG